MACSKHLKVGKIGTVDKGQQPNGHVLTLVNEHEPDTLPIEQVYITVCTPGDIKGPHLHEGNKHDRFYCISGKVALVCRDEETGEITEYVLEALDDQLILIPPYNSHALVALGTEDAVVLSVPNEGYCPGKPYNQRETTYDGYDWNKWQ